MRFINELDTPLDFEFHGRKRHVDARGDWECPDPLAYAVKLLGLPLMEFKDVPPPPPDPQPIAVLEATAPSSEPKTESPAEGPSSETGSVPATKETKESVPRPKGGK